MANASLQGHQQPAASVCTTNGAYYGATTTYQHQQQQYGGGSYYNNSASSASSQQTAYWNGQSNGAGYNQSAGYYNTGACQSSYQRTHWNNGQQQQPAVNDYYTQQQYAMVAANGTRSTAKRAYPSVGTAPLHDITNNAHSVAGNQTKRRRMATNYAYPSGSSQNGTVRQPTAVAPIKVRIESIFRHVELLAQSHWQTSGSQMAADTSTLKPATVDALEGTA